MKTTKGILLRLLGLIGIIWVIGGIFAFAWLADAGAQGMKVPRVIEIWGWSLLVVAGAAFTAGIVYYLCGVVKWVITGE